MFCCLFFFFILAAVPCVTVLPTDLLTNKKYSLKYRSGAECGTDADATFVYDLFFSSCQTMPQYSSRDYCNCSRKKCELNTAGCRVFFLFPLSSHSCWPLFFYITWFVLFLQFFNRSGCGSRYVLDVHNFRFCDSIQIVSQVQYSADKPAQFSYFRLK